MPSFFPLTERPSFHLYSVYNVSIHQAVCSVFQAAVDRKAETLIRHWLWLYSFKYRAAISSSFCVCVFVCVRMHSHGYVCRWRASTDVNRTDSKGVRLQRCTHTRQHVCILRCSFIQHWKRQLHYTHRYARRNAHTRTQLWGVWRQSWTGSSDSDNAQSVDLWAPCNLCF